MPSVAAQGPKGATPGEVQAGPTRWSQAEHEQSPVSSASLSSMYLPSAQATETPGSLVAGSSPAPVKCTLSAWKAC